MAPANSIYDIILPIYVLSKVLGLAPFTLRRKKLQTQFGLMTILQFIAIIGILSYLIISIERLKYHHGIGEIALKCELYLGKTHFYIRFSEIPTAFCRNTYDIHSFNISSN